MGWKRMDKRKTIVISGINLFEGGPLSIYYDCLDAMIADKYYQVYSIICFVHKKEIFKKYKGYFKFIELPKSRSSYLYRFYYEYVYFHSFSKRHKVDVWLSLHDMTPNVKCRSLYTYCHNSTPFFKADISVLKFNKNTYFMSKFYKFIYRINIKRNTSLIVQQDWIRSEFKRLFGVKNVIVAHPSVKINQISEFECNFQAIKKIFFFPSYPRVFKNFEVICAAAKQLEKSIGQFEVWLTLDGSENKYSNYLKKKYSDVKAIKWIGLQNREEMVKRYQQCNCVIFPSKLETWGLPITEAKAYDIPLLLADLPYAHETVGAYDMVSFFPVDSEKKLSHLMHQVCNGNIEFQGNKSAIISPPYCSNWNELLKMILAT